MVLGFFGSIDVVGGGLKGLLDGLMQLLNRLQVCGTKAGIGRAGFPLVAYFITIEGRVLKV